MKYIPILLSILFVSVLTGCATTRVPKSFLRASSPGWTSIEIRDGVDYDRAWKTTMNILVRDFDLDFVLKDDGYIRTSWLYSWSGVYQENYRVRVTAKFSDDRKKLEVKSEAHALYGYNWVIGVDTRLLSTLKTDLMGTIGRTTR